MEELNLLERLLANKEAILLAVTSTIAAAAAIAALTPTPKDDGIISKIRKVVDFLAMNWLNAANKE